MSAHLACDLMYECACEDTDRERARAERAEAQRDALAEFVRAEAESGCWRLRTSCREMAPDEPLRWCVPCRAADLLATNGDT